MSNEMFVIVVVLAGMCIGSFINLKEHNSSLIMALIKSVLLPIPVFMLVTCLGISIACKAYKNANLFSRVYLFIICISAYADALILIGNSMKEAKTTSDEVSLFEVRKISTRVRRKMIESVYTLI